MWVRPGRKTQHQTTTRPPDFLLEYWATIGEYKKRQEIIKWQQRKKNIDEASAKRSLPLVPVDPSDYYVPAASMKNRFPFIGNDSDDELSVTSVSDTEADTGQSDNADVEF